MSYALTPGLHYCIANRRVALLDVPNNRYFGLPDLIDAVFQKLVLGEGLSQAEHSVLAPLIERGVLVPGQTEAPIPLPPAKPDTDMTGASAPRLADFVSAVGACVTVLQAPHPRLDVMLERLRRRKAKTTSKHRMSECPDLPRALSQLHQVRRMLKLHNRCLPWSAGAASFLLARGIPADFVIGVRMRPFAAHAWVQLDGQVLNDRLDNVLPYTPILVI